MDLSERVRELRRAAGMSAKDLATKAGISAKALSEIENGHTANPSIQTLQGLADALGVPLTALKPRSKGEEVLLMLYRSMQPDQQRQVLANLAALAAGMEVAESFPEPMTLAAS